MVSLLLRSVISLLTIGVVLAQTPEPPVDPKLPDRLKELKSMIADRKMRQDFQAIGLIQDLVKAPDKLNPKDQKRLAKGLGFVFRTGKVRPTGQDHVYREAGDALALLAEDGSKILARTLTNKRLDDNVPLQAHLIEALGRTKDDDQIDWILEQAARSPHDAIRGAAGAALGEFTAAKAKQQREVVKKLIREWGSLHSKATQSVNADPKAPIDFGPQNARKTLSIIEGRWVSTLCRLTGQNMSNFMDWQRWQNKNRRWEPPGLKQ